MSVLGQRIRDRRKQLGLTQIDLAEMTGSQQNQIWAYETGKSPSIEKLERLADALETTTDWLLGRTDVVNPVYEVEGLDSQEKSLVEAYRAKSEDRKPVILEIVKMA